MMNNGYPIYKPKIGFSEGFAVIRSIARKQISGKRNVISVEEKKIGKALNVSELILVSNGTVAIEVVLRVLNLPKGSRILVPENGYIAVANSVIALNFELVVCPLNPDTLQIDLEIAENLIVKKSVSAVIIIHNYGFVTDLNLLQKICNTNGVFLIEDCAEAIGSTFNGTPVGSFGDAATFSFFANKLITSGEGGGVSFKSKIYSERARVLIDQGVKNKQLMTTEVLGFNHRLSAILVGVLSAQSRKINKLIGIKRIIYNYYKSYLFSDKIKFQVCPQGSSDVPWLVNIKFNSNKNRDECIKILAKNKVETRMIFPPLDKIYYGSHVKCNASESGLEIYKHWLSLPSYPGLRKKDIRFICNLILKSLE